MVASITIVLLVISNLVSLGIIISQDKLMYEKNKILDQALQIIRDEYKIIYEDFYKKRNNTQQE